MRRQMAGALCGFLMAASGVSGVMTARADDWMLSDDGKKWMYMRGPNDPVTDEWIEDGEKLYYVDSKGYMKTGWVANKEDGKKYYMGPDGAMAFNTFSTDDRYVGPDGTGVGEYDKYRKAIKSELKISSKSSKTSKNSQSKNGQNQAASEPATQQFFLVTDLNGDGYRDLVVMSGRQEPESLVKVAVWDPQEKKMLLAAEFDVLEQGTKSALYMDPEGEEVWLEMAEPNGDLNLFQLMKSSPVFDNVWNFSMGTGQDGYPHYEVNGVEEDRETWEFLMSKAKQERGSVPVSGYLPVTDENVRVQVDLILDEREIGMWRQEEKEQSSQN